MPTARPATTPADLHHKEEVANKGEEAETKDEVEENSKVKARLKIARTRTVPLHRNPQPKQCLGERVTNGSGNDKR